MLRVVVVNCLQIQKQMSSIDISSKSLKRPSISLILVQDVDPQAAAERITFLEQQNKRLKTDLREAVCSRFDVKRCLTVV